MLDINVIRNGTKVTNHVTFNSVSGTLIKSCEGSKIIRFHQGSKRADQFFDPQNPHRSIKQSIGSDIIIPIIVLQVMLCGDQEFLVEYIEKELDNSDS